VADPSKFIVREVFDTEEYLIGEYLHIERENIAEILQRGTAHTIIPF